jgi:hypothetical protein
MTANGKSVPTWTEDDERELRSHVAAENPTEPPNGGLPEAPASATWRATVPITDDDGQVVASYSVMFTVRDFTVKALVDKVVALTVWQHNHGMAPSDDFRKPGTNGHSPTNGNGTGIGDAPVCPTHGTPMRPGKRGGFYCPKVILPDGGDGRPVYCKQKVEAIPQ